LYVYVCGDRFLSTGGKVNYLLNVTGVSVRYDKTDEKLALCDVGFSVEDGERAAVIGANGAGKSTLLLALTGVIELAAGAVQIDGMALCAKNLKAIRRDIGLLFQNPDDQLFMATVYDDIAFGLRSCGIGEDETALRIDTLLHGFNASELKEKMTHRLSGGEKRLAALMGVLVTNPKLLLLDEPTSFLDPRQRREIINKLKSLPQTVLIATHDLDMVLDLCPRAILLKDGKIMADAPSIDILNDFKLLYDCSLEPPLSMVRGAT
jgi:cobalt/nickel transport system ATP-binding protein